ncbi:MAG: rod shape-determining protein [Bilifractor sp.]
MPVTDIGIDLGTATIIVYVRGKGILFQEPSVVAYDRDANQILAFGSEAAQCIGKMPGNIVGIRPLKDGVISDFVVTERMLRYFIRKSMGNWNILKPRICICVPGGVSDIERRAVEEAAYRAGARDSVLVREPIVAAMGAGVDIMRPCGSMIVNIGGGVSEVAVLSLGGIVISKSVRTAGESFDAAICKYIHDIYGVIIGSQMAENIKIQIGSAVSSPDLKAMQVTGRDVDAGFPRNISITSDQVREAVAPEVRHIIEEIRSVMEKTPPDLAGDIAERGIVLTGGGAMLNGLQSEIERATGIRTLLADHPQQAVALGTGQYIRAMSDFEREKRFH